MDPTREVHNFEGFASYRTRVKGKMGARRGGGTRDRGFYSYYFTQNYFSVDAFFSLVIDRIVYMGAPGHLGLRAILAVRRMTYTCGRVE